MEFLTFSPEIHCFSELLDCSDGDEEEILEFGDDLQLNPFDGLPYSSRYYKLMKERQELPVWKVKYTFMESLLHNQIVIVSGDAKTGKSSQVSIRKYFVELFLFLEHLLLYTSQRYYSYLLVAQVFKIEKKNVHFTVHLY